MIIVVSAVSVLLSVGVSYVICRRLINQKSNRLLAEINMLHKYCEVLTGEMAESIKDCKNLLKEIKNAE